MNFDIFGDSVYRLLNLRKFFIFAQFSKKKVPNHSPENYPNKEKMLTGVIWLFFLDLSKIEKFSEIKLPLGEPNNFFCSMDSFKL